MDKQFEKWAASFAGCDGGDANAEIWLAGIEWGLAKDKGDTEYEKVLRKYYENDLPAKIKSGVGRAESDKYDWARSLTYTYGRSVAKLYCAIKELDIRDYKKLSRSFLPQDIFRVNLYPIAFRGTVAKDAWKKFNLQKMTYCETKELYKFWCFYKRFPFFQEYIANQPNPPKVIICTGVTHLNEFYACFAGNKFSPDIKIEKIKYQRKGQTETRLLYYTKNNSTLFVVIPFFSSQSGLNSFESIQAVGDFIRKQLPVKLVG